LTKQLDAAAEKELEIKSLQVRVAELSAQYEEAKKRVESSIETAYGSKTRQFHQVIKDLSMQVSVLLFENTKLRRFIEKETGKVVMPLPLGLFGEEPLPGQDQRFFTEIESLVRQNNELKLSQASHVEKPSSSTRTEKESDVLLAKISSLTESIKKSDQEKESWKRRTEDLTKKSRELAEKLNQLQTQKTHLESDLASKNLIIEQLKTNLVNPEQFQRKDLIDAYSSLTQTEDLAPQSDRETQVRNRRLEETAAGCQIRPQPAAEQNEGQHLGKGGGAHRSKASGAVRVTGSKSGDFNQDCSGKPQF
jgi:hypothetical protein